ncbi:winged helix-turn-helix transcriptional regulator [Thalassotalea aquiviva]|uniref:winged helix-turn-helix transcriptional regulator n=1 Tax=Thalassotalea aquiviva TaxID=3242415 RepID=UPI00352ADE5F
MRNLDKIDLQILEILQQKGRISNVELAKNVNLSASPCLDRVKRLENEGYIKRYGAVLDAEKLNVGMSAFIQVTLDRAQSDIFSLFRAKVVNIKEVVECHMVAGGFDYLIKLRFKDISNYRAVLGEFVDLPGISQTHTYIVIEKVKEDTGLHLLK